MSNFILSLLLLASGFLGLQAQDTLHLGDGLKYIRIGAGTGDNPRNGQKMKVHYIGKLANGKIFQALGVKESFSFTLGDNTIIQGWNVGFAQMRKNEKGILIVPPHLAYGAKGVEDPEEDGKFMIPPNSELLYEVTLIDFK